MPVPILIKRSAVAGKVPATTDLVLGELAVNTVDGKLFLKKNVSGVETVVQVSGGAADLTGSILSANVTASSLTSVGTLTNLTVSNTITGSVSGNAATATKLATARNINGVAFDGTTDILLPVTYNLQKVNGNTAVQRYKIALLPISTAGTYDHINLSGVFDNGWGADNKYPFLITAGNRSSSGTSGLKVKYLYGPPIGFPSHIDMYVESDGSVSVWAVLDANLFSVIDVSITASLQVATFSNPQNSIPTGTLSWSSSTTGPAISTSATGELVTTRTVNLPSITKTGTTGTGDIGQAANKFGTVYATTFSGTATNAQYADLAELYMADADYEPGTVLVFGGEKEVTVTGQYADSRVAGAVSTAPAYLMNSSLAGGVAIALRGRVPVKVIGQVAKGDLLVASSTPGYAVSAGKQVNLGSAVFAKALGAKATSDTGVIEAVIL